MNKVDIHLSSEADKGKPTPEVADAAREYLEDGFQPVPLHGGLKPVAKFTWSTITSITAEEIPKWFSAHNPQPSAPGQQENPLERRCNCKELR